jgi:hypothetical protein
VQPLRKKLPVEQPSHLAAQPGAKDGHEIRLAQRIAIKSAYLLGPGDDRPEEKWWFDMEYENGIIQSREQTVNQREFTLGKRTGKPGNYCKWRHNKENKTRTVTRNIRNLRVEIGERCQLPNQAFNFLRLLHKVNKYRGCIRQ